MASIGFEAPGGVSPGRPENLSRQFSHGYMSKHVMVSLEFFFFFFVKHYLHLYFSLCDALRMLRREQDVKIFN